MVANFLLLQSLVFFSIFFVAKLMNPSFLQLALILQDILGQLPMSTSYAELRSSSIPSLAPTGSVGPLDPKKCAKTKTLHSPPHAAQTKKGCVIVVFF